MSSRVDWKSVTDRVGYDFPSYIPVPSLGDTENYKLLTFLLLKKNPNQSPLSQSVTNLFLAQQPPFYPIGRDVFKLKSKKKAVAEPKIHSGKLCNNDESESKSSTTATATVSKNVTGEVGQHSASPPISLGTITQRKVDYGVLNAWLKKLVFKSDIINNAREGNLLIIHDVIMAEKLAFAGENEETEYSGEVSTPFGGIKGKYGWSRSTSNLSRPEDYGMYVIGYKVGKLRARQVEAGTSSFCFLKLEQRQYFYMPYADRNFYETAESGNDEQDSDEENRETRHKLSCCK